MLGFLLTLALIGATVYYFTTYRKKQLSEKAKREKQESKQAAHAKKPAKQSSNSAAATVDSDLKKPTSTPAVPTTSAISKKKDTHHHHNKIVHKHIDDPLFSGSVKGFAGDITDYDFNSEYLVVAAKDKHIRVFKISDLAAGQYFYFSLEFGYATAVAISADSKHIAYALHVDQSIEVRSLDAKNADVKKRTSAPKSFGKGCHKEDIMKLSFDTHAKFIISSASKSDTHVKIWSLSGKELSNFNTAHNQHYMAKFSQLRRFYLIASWTSSLKALSFTVDKQNEFRYLGKAFALSHDASISFVNCDNTDRKAITVSKNEKSIKFWDIDEKFEVMDPRLIKQFKGEADHATLYDGKLGITSVGAVHSLSNPSKVIYAVSNGTDICILSEKFTRIALIKEAVTDECSINALEFIQPNDSSLFLLSTSFNEGRMNIFNLSAQI